MKWALLLLAPFLFSCGTDRVAGASTETTNGLGGVVVLPSGAAARGARVQITDPTGTSVVVTCSTDTRGRWMANLPSGTYGVLVVATDGTRAWIYPRTFSINEAQAFATAPVGSLVAGAGTRLAATPFRSANGRYDSLAPGAYTVLSDSSTPMPLGSARVKSGDSTLFTGVRDSGLLFEDFDAGSPGFLYGGWHPTLHWYAQNSSVAEGGVLISPATDGGVTAALDTAGAWKGRSLSIRYTSKDTASFVQVGHYLPRVMDLSALRSIRIRARGDGILRIHFAATDANNAIVRTQWQAVPNGKWTEYVFRPGEELPPGPSGNSSPDRVAWSSISTGVWHFMIQAYGGTWMQIDDIRLDGIPPSAFLDAGR